MKPDDYIEIVRGWIGTPFVHQGRTCQLAADCLGLVYGSAIDLGLIDEQWRPYSRQPSAGELEKALRTCEAVRETRRPQAGDILVFRFARDLQHVGVYTGRNLIHAYEPMGKTVEHRYCKKWENRHLLTFRFKAFG